MAYVRYWEVGKEVLAVGLAGTAIGAVHFMFLAPQFAGQKMMGVSTVTIVDVVVAFIIGVATTMYAKTLFGKLLGYGAAATIFAVGVLAQLGYIGGVATARARFTPPASVFSPQPISQVPRATYLAPAGVVVNKHGTVPELAPGTFG